MATLTDIHGIGPALAQRLTAAGITTIDSVAASTPATLSRVHGLSASTAARVIAEAMKVGGLAEAAVSPSKPKPDPAFADLDERIVRLEATVAKLERQLAKTKKKANRAPAKAKKRAKKSRAMRAERVPVRICAVLPNALKAG